MDQQIIQLCNQLCSHLRSRVLNLHGDHQFNPHQVQLHNLHGARAIGQQNAQRCNRHLNHHVSRLLSLLLNLVLDHQRNPLVIQAINLQIFLPYSRLRNQALGPAIDQRTIQRCSLLQNHR